MKDTTGGFVYENIGSNPPCMPGGWQNQNRSKNQGNSLSLKSSTVANQGSKIGEFPSKSSTWVVEPRKNPGGLLTGSLVMIYDII